MEQIMDDTKVIADLNVLNIFSFVGEDSEGSAELANAEEYCLNQIRRLKELIWSTENSQVRKEWKKELKRVARMNYQMR